MILETGRLDNIDSALIKFCTAFLTLLMKTAESMLSKRPVLKITEPVFFFLNSFTIEVQF